MTVESAAPDQTVETSRRASPKLSTVDRALALFRLFTVERPEWTVEEALQELGLSQSTAYEYFRSLVASGLLSTVRTGCYVIGPAIIELDRQTRRTDPLILAAERPMDELRAALPSDGVILLCRLYRLTVMCVDQRTKDEPKFGISYERGRPMPLSRGSASRVILAALPPRTLKKYFEERQDDDATNDGGWQSFRDALKPIRRLGYSITFGELDAGVVGISAPVFATEREVLGSIGVVISQSDWENCDQAALIARVLVAGQQVSGALNAPPSQGPISL